MSLQCEGRTSIQHSRRTARAASSVSNDATNTHIALSSSISRRVMPMTAPAFWRVDSESRPFPGEQRHRVWQPVDAEDQVSSARLPGSEIQQHGLRHRANWLIASCALLTVPGCLSRPGGSRWFAIEAGKRVRNALFHDSRCKLNPRTTVPANIVHSIGLTLKNHGSARLCVCSFAKHDQGCIECDQLPA